MVEEVEVGDEVEFVGVGVVGVGVGDESEVVVWVEFVV